MQARSTMVHPIHQFSSARGGPGEHISILLPNSAAFLIEILPRYQRAQPRNESEFYLDNVTSKLGRTGNICSAREIFTLFLPVLIENQERPDWNIYVNTWALNWCLDLETSHSCVTSSSRVQDQMKRELCYAMRNAGLPVSLCVVSSNHSFYNYE